MSCQPTIEPMPNASTLKMIAELTYAQEFEVDAALEPNTRHWRHPWCQKENGGQLATRPPILPADAPGTIPALLQAAAAKYPQRRFMGTRKIEDEQHDEGKKKFWKRGPYVWRTYDEVNQDVLAMAKGLLALPGIKERRDAAKAAGPAGGEECIAALLAETSSEWQISAQAALTCGLTLTTVYATLGHEAMLHGLQETKAQIIFVDYVQYQSLVEDVLSKCPDLEHVVLIGQELSPVLVDGEPNADPFPSEPPTTEAFTATITTLPTLVKAGAGAAVADFLEVAPTTDEVALIMYTSGSTGLPKGVVLTHKNFVSVIASTQAQGALSALPEQADTVIAYLPLAHILELIVEVATISQGGGIGYAHPRSLTGSSPYIRPGDEDSPDLTALQPTMMAAVPAILDLIQNGLKKKITEGSGIVRDLFFGAMERKMGESSGVELGCWTCCSCLDNWIMNTVKGKLGMSNMRLLISGGAPLSAATQAFCAAALAPVAQGYGATETVGCATVQEVIQTPGSGRPVDSGTGHVGAIQPATELKLLSVEEMGYLVTDEPNPRGEILVSGSNVSDHGYYKLPEKTAEDFITHPDGKLWFHTGDIGVICADGNLKIIDRKKDLIKLSGGEYVSLGKVESLLKQVKGIGACVVFAQAHKDHCVVIVSQPEKGWGSVGGIPDEATLVTAIAAELKKAKCAKFEIPTKVKVCPGEPWTPETGLVTASLKVQRNPLRNHYNGPDGLLSQMGYTFE